jgi:DNA-binding protein H-NS
MQSKMTYAEITQEIERLKQEAEQVRRTELKAAIDAIRATMDEFGLRIADLGFSAAELAEAVGGRRGRGRRRATAAEGGADQRQIVEPKYRDPASGSTWSGRGRMPRWLSEAVGAGRSKAEFLISGA